MHRNPFSSVEGSLDAYQGKLPHAGKGLPLSLNSRALLLGMIAGTSDLTRLITSAG